MTTWIPSLRGVKRFPSKTVSRFDAVAPGRDGRQKAMMEKKVVSMERKEIQGGRVLRNVPYYGQTRRFSCGPSSLIMAMGALEEGFHVERALEFELWREATTIHGGCGPLGLALTLCRRGFTAEVWMSHDGVFAGCRAKDTVERETMKILQERDRVEAESRDIPVAIGTLSVPCLRNRISLGWLPIAMVNIDFEGKNITHWVIVVGYDHEAVYVNDPLVDGISDDSRQEGHSLKILQADFERWAEFGLERERAIVLAGPKAV